MRQSGGLSNLQLELIKLFNYDLNENQLLDIKNMLSEYFANKATEKMDQFWEEQNLDNKIMEKWSKEHLRKKN